MELKKPAKTTEIEFVMAVSRPREPPMSLRFVSAEMESE